MNNTTSVVEQIFSVYDKDNSGYLDKTEAKKFIVHIYKQLGQELTPEGESEIYKMFDINEDGYITKGELIKIINGDA